MFALAIGAHGAAAAIVRKEEQAALQHLVGGGTDARYEVRRIEGRLSNFGETVSVITIQHDSASQQIKSICVVSIRRARYQIQTG